jgi:hypothetical protein
MFIESFILRLTQKVETSFTSLLSSNEPDSLRKLIDKTTVVFADGQATYKKSLATRAGRRPIVENAVTIQLPDKDVSAEFTSAQSQNNNPHIQNNQAQLGVGMVNNLRMELSWTLLQSKEENASVAQRRVHQVSIWKAPLNWNRNFEYLRTLPCSRR